MWCDGGGTFEADDGSGGSLGYFNGRSQHFSLLRHLTLATYNLGRLGEGNLVLRQAMAGRERVAIVAAICHNCCLFRSM